MGGLWGFGTADLKGEGTSYGRAAIEDGSRAAVAGAENGSRNWVFSAPPQGEVYLRGTNKRWKSRPDAKVMAETALATRVKAH